MKRSSLKIQKGNKPDKSGFYAVYMRPIGTKVHIPNQEYEICILIWKAKEQKWFFDFDPSGVAGSFTRPDHIFGFIGPLPKYKKEV